jgi:phosphoribosylformylglycinamidine synthase subunit PurQ / glutaminase
MDATPLALIVRAPGTNCDQETIHAFELAGARTQSIHIRELVKEPQQLERAQIFCVPGGFSYGDDIAAGRIFAQDLRDPLAEGLNRFRDNGGLILGICNGFQVLLQTSLLIPNNGGASARATLALNTSGKFEARWVHLRVAAPHSIFLRGIDRLYLPVAHAEGRFALLNPAELENLKRQDQIALRYTFPEGAKEHDEPLSQLAYPWNPNGSIDHIAGICDSTGHVLGLMPHPERFVSRLQHPRWTREELPEEGAGLAIFKNAVRYFG